MRVLIAMLKHETNSFSPVVTDLDRFGAWGLHRGAAVREAYTGTAMPTAAYLELAQAHCAEVETPVAAEAMPSGPVEPEAYDSLVEEILAPVRRGGIDAAFLDLHGAMTARHVDDGEGELLRRLRELAPHLPIAVTLDLHTNLSGAMARHCDALIGYKTYPHVDMYAVGKQIGEVLWRHLGGAARPVTVWGAAPVLAQTLCMGTDDEPMSSLQAAARAAEDEPGILAATVFGGFPMVDVPHAGASVAVVADGEAQRAHAEDVRDRLLDLVTAARRELVYRHRPLAAALAAAAAERDFPVVLLDHADNVGSGGTSDVMAVIDAVLRAGLDGVAAAAVYDPQAVAEMSRAGVGATLTLALGGRHDMPAIGRRGEPLTLSGEVLALNDGRWIVRGPMYTGVQVDTGPTAVLRVAGMRIVVTSKHHEPWDTGILSENGIDPAGCRYLLLKSRIHYRAGFAPLARATHALDGLGVTTSDNRLLRYRRLRRPIYPLDPLD